MIDDFVEFGKQYLHTYIRVRFEEQKDFSIFYVKDCISGDNTKPYIVLHNSVLGQCTVNWENTKQNIDYSFPPIGLFNYKEGFFMFHRFPDRQWKRGISNGNSHIADPFRDFKLKLPELHGLIPNSISIDFAILNSVFAQVFPESLDHAIEEIQKGRVGIALNPVFGMSVNSGSDPRLILWKHLNMIGFVDPETNMINVEEPTFLQETNDFIIRQKEYFWRTTQ